MRNFVTFYSTREHGVMNTDKRFYDEEMDASERKFGMELHKELIASEIGIDWKKIFLPIQKEDKYEHGACYTLTRNDIAKYPNLYDYDVYTDIAKVTSETPNIVLANNIADCANVIAMNLKTEEAVVAHCGGAQINRMLPMQTIDALGGNEKDIIVSVSPFAHLLSYEYGEPTWISNSQVWNGCINRIELPFDRSILYINQLEALKKQFILRKIPMENLIVSPLDTMISEELYSNSLASSGHKEAAGRFISGVVLMEEEHAYHQPYIKSYPVKR